MEGKSVNTLYLALGFILANAFLQGCKEDVFDAEKVKAAYEDRFPVKDIDPDMDWKTTRTVPFSITVHKDADTDYNIRIYDNNPLSESFPAHILAEGMASNITPFTSIMDCPLNITEAYVCLTDAANRSIVKLCSIDNDRLQTSFGLPPAARFATRAEANSSITTYTPDPTESEVAHLASTAPELRNNTVIQKGDVYKISQGDTYRGNIYTDGIPDGIATVIIEGTWDPKGNIARINTGIDLIVTGTGKIVLPDGTKDNKSLYLIGSSRLIVFEGGSIHGENSNAGFIYYLSNASKGRVNYNAGTIQVKDIQIDESNGTFYNCGTLDVQNLTISNTGSKLVNQGQATLGTVNVNSLIENGCRLTVTELLCGDLTLGDNSSAVIANYGISGNSSKIFTMGSNSMLTITGKAYFSYATHFIGPQNGYALAKIGNLVSINGFQHESGNIYYEVEKETVNNEWERNTFLKYLLNSEGILAKWGESPILIPSGECTGEGNTPPQGSGTSDDKITYTYAYENNFPLVGDYDFNDIVLDVQTVYHRESKTNAIKRIQLDVTLAAAGAGRTTAAGLRIVGISKSDISVITTGGDDRRFQETLTSPRTGKKFFSYNPSTHMEDGDNDVVIPLFNDEHQLFDVPLGTHVNTYSTDALHEDGKKTYTYEIIIELADQTKTNPLFSKDNLDFFICYQYRTMQKRMEVHLYEFWKYGATAGGTVQQTNLDLAGNNTWAVCVPNFRYPKEFTNISVSSDPSMGAYPKFLDWARNRNVSQDWYLFPNEDNVCR